MSLQFIGDIIVVEHEETNVKSDIIFIPQDHQKTLYGIKARVLFVGKLTPAIRKASLKKRKVLAGSNKISRTFPGDDLKPGDIVIVPEHLGSRNRIPSYPNAIVYDGEDILCKLSSE